MKLLYLFLGTLLFTSTSFAQVIQILHTNDLHSHLEHTTHRPDMGGYARLKVMLDRHRQLAAEKGIATIAMDAGDFMEGSIFYMADRGRKTFESFGKIGHDVAVFGNHDYLMGPADLDAILRDVPPPNALLAANLKVSSAFPNINEHVKPVWETVKNGVKIGVIGITTNDLLYKWRLKGGGGLEKENETAKKWAKYLRDRGNEVIIALTHIGVKKDKSLAFNVPEIDIIVGGHSHDELHKVVYQKNSKGKEVPIVQAGFHGEWMGRLIFNYDRSKKAIKVMEYGLRPVIAHEEDPEMLDQIASANEELDNFYGKEWLAHVVGQSELRPTSQIDDNKIWQFFVNDAMLESSKADLSIHVPSLSGHNYPLGKVTRRDLYEGNPRTFDFDDKLGYHIYTAKIAGAWLELIATTVMNFNVPLYFSGIEFKWKKKKGEGKYWVWDIKHKGNRLNPFKLYTVSFSEGIVRGAYEISPLTKLLIKDGRKTDVPMWTALEEKFSREGTLRLDYLERHWRRGPASETKMERVFVPMEE